MQNNSVAPSNNQYGVLPQQSPYEHGNMATVAIVGTIYSNPLVLRNDHVGGGGGGTNYSNPKN
jgi:hypothetical protein